MLYHGGQVVSLIDLQSADFHKPRSFDQRFQWVLSLDRTYPGNLAGPLLADLIDEGVTRIATEGEIGRQLRIKGFIDQDVDAWLFQLGYFLFPFFFRGTVGGAEINKYDGQIR